MDAAPETVQNSFFVWGCGDSDDPHQNFLTTDMWTSEIRLVNLLPNVTVGWTWVVEDSHSQYGRNNEMKIAWNRIAVTRHWNNTPIPLFFPRSFFPPFPIPPSFFLALLLPSVPPISVPFSLLCPIFLFAAESRQSLGSIRREQESFPPGLNWPGHKADHSPLSTAGFKNAWNYISSNPCLHGVVLS